MNETVQQLAAHLQVVWRRRWLAAGVAWALALLGFAMVSMVPDRYEASARVYVDTQTVLKPLMAGLAFQPDIDMQVRMLARTLISRPNVEQLLDSPGIDLGPDAKRDRERSIDRLMETIKVDSSGGNLYVVSFRDADSARARAIVTRLVELFVGSGADSKRRDSQDASTFIDAQIKNYDGKLAEAEARLKDFKVRTFGVTGLSNQDYYSRTSTMADEVSRLRIALSGAEQARDALRRELAREDPRLPAAAPATPALPTELDSRIEAQRRQLDELLRKYTDAHPDVLNARRIVGQLEAERRAEVAGSSKARLGGASGDAATSPVYQRIRVALAEAEANAASLRSQLGAQQSRLDQTRATASKVPQAEAELAQLNRDYDVIRKNYDLLVSRREAALLGVKMDKSAPLADFRIIEPPHVAPKPVFPDRRVLSLAAMLIAVSAGIGIAYLMGVVAPAFNTSQALQAFTKRPVIGTIGTYPDTVTLALRKRELFRFGGVVVALCLCEVVWFTWVALGQRTLS